MSSTSSLRQKKQNQLYLDFFRGGFSLSFAQKNERHLSYHPWLTAIFTLKRLVFSTTVRFFSDTLFLAFVGNLRGVHKMLWNEFGFKTCECSGIIPVNDQLDAQFFFCVFISIFYMFRATSCSSSGESIVSIPHLVCVTPCRWQSSVQVGKFLPDLRNRRSPTQCDTYHMLY
jgi:hypothetical protein